MEDMKTLANGGQSRDQEHEPLANIGTNEDEKHEHLADGSTNKDEEHNKDSFSMHDTTKMRGTGVGGGREGAGSHLKKSHLTKSPETNFAPRFFCCPVLFFFPPRGA